MAVGVSPPKKIMSVPKGGWQWEGTLSSEKFTGFLKPSQMNVQMNLTERKKKKPYKKPTKQTNQPNSELAMKIQLQDKSPHLHF